jgi:hypothetical protein
MTLQVTTPGRSQEQNSSPWLFTSQLFLDFRGFKQSSEEDKLSGDEHVSVRPDLEGAKNGRIEKAATEDTAQENCPRRNPWLNILPLSPVERNLV